MKRIEVKIVNKEHPHCGKYGTIKVNDNDTVTIEHLPYVKTPMVRVKLDDFNECFAKQSDLKFIELVSDEQN